MRHVIAVVVLLVAACAPEVPTMAETSGGEQGAAGSVGADKEALTAATNGCGRTIDNWETVCRGTFGGTIPGGATRWSGPLNGQWIGNNNAGEHVICSLVGTDTVNSVRRQCVMTDVYNHMRYVDNIDCYSGFPVTGGSLEYKESVHDTRTSPSNASFDIWSSNPCN